MRFIPLMSVLTAQVAAPTDALPSWISTLISLGGFGYAFFMLSTDRWVTGGRHAEVKSERDEWRKAAEIALTDKRDQVERDRVQGERDKNVEHLFEEMKRIAEENRRS